ncbi:hypothetical protein B4099_3222 [Heyndrickxia coagulans]|uniref:Uncharacterized protein n=1 Tax=Heyndrickxia coagulans TaxID=1398 RepID=A0A150KH25_HEYCO|nr:hypothetical protein B4099_3222 [Heyndrickxia coagulans]
MKKTADIPVFLSMLSSELPVKNSVGCDLRFAKTRIKRKMENPPFGNFVFT